MKRFLFVSQLTSHAHLTRLADVFRQVRAIARLGGLTGLLVFDGDLFGHYLEGPAPALDALMARIRSDDRHVNFVALLDEPWSGPRLFAQWSVGFAIDDEAKPLAQLAPLRGEAALQHFLALSASLDKVT